MRAARPATSPAREKLERSIALAREAGLEEDVARGYSHLAWAALRNRDYALADAALAGGLEHCAEPRLDLWRLYLQGFQSRSQLDQGRWTEAAETASVVLGDARTSSIPRILAGVTLGLVRARRGDPGSADALDAAARAVGGAPRSCSTSRPSPRRAPRSPGCAAIAQGVAQATEAAFALAERARRRRGRRRAGAVAPARGDLRGDHRRRRRALRPRSSPATGRRRPRCGPRSGARTTRRWRWPTATPTPGAARWTSCTSSAPARRRRSSPGACARAGRAGCAAGRGASRASNPANLTPRQVEVLALWSSRACATGRSPSGSSSRPRRSTITSARSCASSASTRAARRARPPGGSGSLPTTTERLHDRPVGGDQSH